VRYSRLADMPTKTRSKHRGTKPKAKKPPSPFDRNKPLVEMSELEWKRMNDELGLELEEPMLRDARDGQGTLLVAAAVLVLPTGEARLLCDGDEWGDGEGSILAEHTVAIAGRAMKPAESVRLDLVTVQIASDGTCSCTVRAGEGAEHEVVDDILAPSLMKKLDAARRRGESEDADYSLVVLTTTSGAKRIVFADIHDGVGGEARSANADFVLRVRRLKWLKPGEIIDRTRLKLRLSGTQWTPVATLDPVPVSGR
jgi:hypothetical protein